LVLTRLLLSYFYSCTSSRRSSWVFLWNFDLKKEVFLLELGCCDRKICTNARCICNCVIYLHCFLLPIVHQIFRWHLLSHSIGYCLCQFQGLLGVECICLLCRPCRQEVFSSSIADALSIPGSLGKRQSSIEDHGFIAFDNFRRGSRLYRRSVALGSIGGEN
jgi:hypothetical protein